MQVKTVLIAAIILLMTPKTPQAAADEPQTNFARRQLEQMCEDRPSMAGVLALDDPVYQWVERCLDIGDPKQRIYWIPLEPEAGCQAQNNPKYSPFPAQVRLTNDPNLSGEDLWVMLIYELHNIDNSNDFHRLSNSVWHGNITADQYADKALLLELAAEVRTKLFLRRHVRQSHGLARSSFYEHYMALADKAPSVISPTDRERCKVNLEIYRKWATDTIALRSLYQRR